jgi:hypothetical protein
MKRVPWLLALLGVLLLSAVPVLADDGFYVIPVGRPSVGIKITSLPYTISTPGYYYFTGNLSHGGSAGIVINTDNVTLDLMGFALIGPANNSDYGIVWGTQKNIEVRNGTVTGWSIGVYGNDGGGAHHRLINLRANGNTYGIWMNGDDVLIQGCTAAPGSFGSSSGYGLTIYNFSGAVTGCTVTGFPENGIFIDAGRVSGNAVQGCNGIGIYARSSATISYNTVGYCATGISNSGGGSIIGNVVATGTGQTGIVPSMGTAYANVLDQNTVGGAGTHYDTGSTATVWGLNAGR